MNDKEFLQRAIEKAKESIKQGGFPAGAIIVKNGQIIGEGISVGNKIKDPTNHGEIAAIRKACKKLQTSDLSGATLYASLQPCLMCFGAAIWSSISKIVFACSKDKVSAAYYGGNYNLTRINSKLINQLELIHMSELEAEALKIVHEWEESN